MGDRRSAARQAPWLVKAAVLAVALSFSSCSTWWTTGSLYRSKKVHVGVRPAAETDGVAITVQVTADVP